MYAVNRQGTCRPLKAINAQGVNSRERFWATLDNPAAFPRQGQRQRRYSVGLLRSDLTIGTGESRQGGRVCSLDDHKPCMAQVLRFRSEQGIE